ncbi:MULTISPECIES: division/cell wall cluster transcriptional repressor MraZ [Cellulomonas]|uniref:Transcriptional regulator MraZ n=1 Tax=Cellulomonas oligotrophica TaxID=931536 RepID=A0A7Y9FJ05_9CELL|nr:MULTISPECIES: division/cell wall cluster transcriptional repressor MraZ [Cellulomonas]NYD88223.1 MraZ protein [Cellulomonas oligotrophica]TQL04453.1 MraZ protein [Cellulomonas sp. SLBN-39]GIG33914.1 transcriptional regulator MraZ [Cellulomonas oligotrophica]
MSHEQSGAFGSSAPFLGTYTPRLDDKGRLILPAKFRPQLAPGLVMTRGQERCLFLLPMDEFGRMHDRLRTAPVTSKQARDYLRVFLSGASDEVPDKQGRITVPPLLRRYAGLDRDVAVIGTGTRVEIWDLPAWESYLAEQEAGYAGTTEEIFPDGPF